MKAPQKTQKKKATKISVVDDDEYENSCFSCCFKIKQRPLVNGESIQQPHLSRNQSNHYQSIHDQVEYPIQNSTLLYQEVFPQVNEIINIKNKVYRRDFPINRAFFLPTKSQKHAIIAKITENKFNNLAKVSEKQYKVPKDQKITEDPFQKQTPQCRFSTTIEKRIKVEVLENGQPHQEYVSSITLSEATPEDIAKYIAKRVRGTAILIDIGCGVGQNTAQFAQECDLTIGIEIDKNNINIANYYCSQIYKCIDKVDFIQADCSVAMKRLKAELIFVNPSVRNEQNIDLFNDTTPDLRQLIENSLDIAPNLIILVPKNIDFQQIASMFYAYFKKTNNIHHYDYLFAIEIETIVIEQSVEYHIIYFGNKSSLQKNEILEFLQETLFSQGTIYKGTNYSQKMKKILNQVEQAVGNNIFILYDIKGPFQLASLIYQLHTHQNPTIGILGQFLIEMYQRNLIDDSLMNRISQSQT